MKTKLAFIKIISNLFCLCVLLLTPLTVWATDQPADAGVRGAELQGELAKGYSAHYLAVVPTERDGTLSLTLTVAPKVDTRAASQVNLWVLSPEGLRRFQEGEKPEHVAIAAGNPTVLDADADAEEFYTKEASFKASGRQTYTVIVFSRALVATSYTLAVTNGALLDASAQTKTVAKASAPSAPAAAVTPTVVQSQPTAQATAQPKPTNPPSSAGNDDDEGGGDE